MLVTHAKKRTNVSFCINCKIFEEWFIEWAIITKLFHTKNISPSGLTNFSFTCWEVGQWLSKTVLKYGFHNKSFILNAPLVSCPIPVIRSGWVQQQIHPKRMTGIGKLTRGAFRIKDLLWNPHFSQDFHILEILLPFRHNFLENQCRKREDSWG